MGRDHEDVAIQVYCGIQQRKNVTVFQNGLFISPEEPFLAATPDRICYDPSEENPWGLVEAKAPYKAREMTPTKAAKELKNFCSVVGEDGCLHLKRDHEYFQQVQGQIALTGANWCDFIIYTKCGLAVERIYFNEKFWTAKVASLLKFYFKYYQPLLL